MEKIIIGSDHGGYNLKNQIIEHFTKMGYAFDDRGCFSTESCDYPVIAKDVVKEVLKTSGRGILVCGSFKGAINFRARIPIIGLRNIKN